MSKFVKKLYKMRYLPLLLVPLLVVMTVLPGTLVAATTPDLGQADSFFILSSTYTNTASGTTITGDLGYTTGPAVAPTVNGSTFGPSSKYNQAGIDQGVALAALNSQVAAPIFTFAPGAIDLAIDTTHGTIGVYTPGIYVITGAASIGTGGITLDGSGTYIFRMTGALNTVAGSVVTLINGASPCDVFWTPGEATTLGANSTFVGTDIDASGITIGSTVNWAGRALAFGGTVSTNIDTLTIVPCSTGTTPAILHVIKHVINNDGRKAVSADFSLHVKTFDTDVAASPAPGAESPGTTYTLAPGTYVVSEDSPSGYAKSYSGDSDSDGNITLASGDEKTVTITNNDRAKETTETTEVAAAEETTAPTETTAITTATTTPVTSTVTGGQLPKTGTPWYNILLIGIALVLIGAVSWVIIKKKTE